MYRVSLYGFVVIINLFLIMTVWTMFIMWWFNQSQFCFYLVNFAIFKARIILAHFLCQRGTCKLNMLFLFGALFSVITSVTDYPQIYINNVITEVFRAISETTWRVNRSVTYSRLLLSHLKEPSSSITLRNFISTFSYSTQYG